MFLEAEGQSRSLHDLLLVALYNDLGVRRYPTAIPPPTIAKYGISDILKLGIEVCKFGNECNGLK